MIKMHTITSTPHFRQHGARQFRRAVVSATILSGPDLTNSLIHRITIGIVPVMWQCYTPTNTIILTPGFKISYSQWVTISTSSSCLNLPMAPAEKTTANMTTVSTGTQYATQHPRSQSWQLLLVSSQGCNDAWKLRWPQPTHTNAHTGCNLQLVAGQILKSLSPLNPDHWTHNHSLGSKKMHWFKTSKSEMIGK